MNADAISIIPFEPRYQPGIDAMLASIVPEYAEPFFHQPLRKMEELYLLPDRYYWIALADEKVIGSVGIVIADGYAILKSLFLARESRGQNFRIAFRLLQTASQKSLQHGCRHLILGTMEQFKAAQRFYEKHGFTLIEKEALPAGYPHNVIDTVFYKLTFD